MHAITDTEAGSRMIMLSGVIDEAEAAAVRSALIDAVWRRGPGDVIVEIGATVAMDDTLLGALMAASAVAADRGATVLIRCEAAGIKQRLVSSGCVLTPAA